MKISTTWVLSAALVLSSCAHIDPRSQDDDNNSDVDTAKVDNGKPANSENSKLVERELTPEIISALDIPDAAAVVVIDFLGNPISFVKKGLSKPVTYPEDTTQIRNVYTATFVWFQGSFCVDITDSAGRSERICR